MSKLDLKITPPTTKQINQVFSEIERNYSGKVVTPSLISDMEREAARLVKRLLVVKATYIKE